MPAVLDPTDGASVYPCTAPGSTPPAPSWTPNSASLAAARRGGGRAISGVRVGIAVAEAAANGIDAQRRPAGHGPRAGHLRARLQLALAPAGTGKTTAMRVLARAWRTPAATVLGLAPSAVAAEQLAPCDRRPHRERRRRWTGAARP